MKERVYPLLTSSHGLTWNILVGVVQSVGTINAAEEVELLPAVIYQFRLMNAVSSLVKDKYFKGQTLPQESFSYGLGKIVATI